LSALQNTSIKALQAAWRISPAALRRFLIVNSTR
jgi:hypothetical protein